MAGTFQPINLKEALEFLHSQHALVLAGGTDFMLMRARLTRDDRPVLCVGHLEELRQIKISGQELSIGAACTLTQLLQSPLLPEYLKRPIAGMASPAIRNIATIGGNICNASPAGDALPMLYALDAVLCLQSASGIEELPIQSYIITRKDVPGRQPAAWRDPGFPGTGLAMRVPKSRAAPRQQPFQAVLLRACPGAAGTP